MSTFSSSFEYNTKNNLYDLRLKIPLFDVWEIQLNELCLSVWVQDEVWKTVAYLDVLQKQEKECLQKVLGEVNLKAHFRKRNDFNDHWCTGKGATGLFLQSTSSPDSPQVYHQASGRGR